MGDVRVRLSGCMDLCAFKNVVQVSGENGDLWYGRIDRDSDAAELAARIADWRGERYAKLGNDRLIGGEGEVAESVASTAADALGEAKPGDRCRSVVTIMPGERKRG